MFLLTNPIWFVEGMNTIYYDMVFIEHVDENMTKEERLEKWRMNHDDLLGFLFSKEDAIKAVLDNDCDLFECTNRYVVVFPICEGIEMWCDEEDETWFEWKEDHYEMTDPPSPRSKVLISI